MTRQVLDDYATEKKRKHKIHYETYWRVIDTCIHQCLFSDGRIGNRIETWGDILLINASAICLVAPVLTHWGRVTHICVGNLTIIGSVNGLSPGRRQAIIWNNAGLLLIEPLGTDFSEISIGIQTFSFQKCTWTCRLRNGVHFVLASMC